MSKKNNSKKSKFILPNVRLLSEQQLDQVMLKPEESFMPEEIRDYLRQGRKEYDRRWQLKEEARQKRKMGPREKPDPKLLAKQGKLGF
ncbi:hypothetical protein A3B87_02670 [Candidatus Kuenenbacteria bacterium RIFCSPHIGHO2_02_FULL_39_13]|uniref:Uncharacterized protein n=1 Tax=Candidatus Kuenenbacteria bacterium RIFCSPHIGHO2_02_FULL_39_13 TaxID=1798561 RepID=A0A1F6FLH9_9BACT|nr:MAG: hypothetical protein A3B87_02670 [Candidatus Kuenenbacteria bacterium RIFCSPHIGHO2_02_FULL_39_13]